MNEPEGTGSDRGRGPDEDIVLPSWIDAAISRTQGDEPAHHEAMDEPEALPEEDVEPMPDEPPTEEYVRPLASTPATEPFPSFLDRRSSMEYESERVSQQEFPVGHEQPMEAEPIEMEPMPVEPMPMEPMPMAPTRQAATAPQLDEFDMQREEILTEALRESSPPPPEPIPLPVAPPRRRPPSGPWLVAAVFFAAAAAVLAILIWLKPLPK